MNKELSLLGLANKAGKLAIGDEAVWDVIRHGSARLIIVAGDAASNTKRRFEVEPGEYHCKRVEITATKAELGGALGRATCAVCALCDIGFTASFLRILTAQNPDDAELKDLYEKMNGRADEINEARREKRKEEKAAERAKARPWAAAPAKKQEKKPEKKENRPNRNGYEQKEQKKNAFSYKKVYGKPGPVRDETGKVRAYEKGDSKNVGAKKSYGEKSYGAKSYGEKSYGDKSYGGKSRGQGGFKRAGSFIGKNNGGYKPYYGEGTKKSKG